MTGFSKWFVRVVGAAIVGVIINDFYNLIKAGVLFDALESASGDVVNLQYLRTDLVDATKQSIAEWILGVSCLFASILTILTKPTSENWFDCIMSSFLWGFALGMGLIFLLSNFDRLNDLHLALGMVPYTFTGIFIISWLIETILYRIKARCDSRENDI